VASMTGAPGVERFLGFGRKDGGAGK